jgi:hypothetical protein
MIRRPDHALSQTHAPSFHLGGGGTAATAAVAVAAPLQLLSLDARKQKAKLSLESELERIVSQHRTNILQEAGRTVSQEAGHAVSQEAGHAVSELLFLHVRKLDKPFLFRNTNSFKPTEKGKEGGGEGGGGGGGERGGSGDPGGEGEWDHVRLAENCNNVTDVSCSGHGNRPDVPQRFAKHDSRIFHVSQEFEMARDTHDVTVSPSGDLVLPLSLSLSLSLSGGMRNRSGPWKGGGESVTASGGEIGDMVDNGVVKGGGGESVVMVGEGKGGGVVVKGRGEEGVAQFFASGGFVKGVPVVCVSAAHRGSAGGGVKTVTKVRQRHDPTNPPSSPIIDGAGGCLRCFDLDVAISAHSTHPLPTHSGNEKGGGGTGKGWKGEGGVRGVQVEKGEWVSRSPPTMIPIVSMMHIVRAPETAPLRVPVIRSRPVTAGFRGDIIGFERIAALEAARRAAARLGLTQKDPSIGRLLEGSTTADSRMSSGRWTRQASVSQMVS